MQLSPAETGPGPKMSGRHLLSRLNFWAKSQNSYLIKDVTQPQLNSLYQEALRHGIKDGNVVLSNGQTWYIKQATGKFHPVGGPGIIQLTRQEAVFMNILVKQIRSGKANSAQALQNLSKAMMGQSYTVSPHMQIALKECGGKLGFTEAQFLKALAPNAPKSQPFTPSPELKSAAKAKAGARAFRLLKWGGRVFLVVAVAADVYEIYEAEDKPKTVTKKVGAWATAGAASTAAGAKASPLLATGPWGWVAYGVVVGGAGVLGYIVGGEATETVYEWVFE